MLGPEVVHGPAVSRARNGPGFAGPSHLTVVRLSTSIPIRDTSRALLDGIVRQGIAVAHWRRVTSVSRIAALAVLVSALFAAPERARATLNITGRWLLVFKSSESPPEAANFVQAGTSLTVTLPADTLTGTIDPATGVFSVSDNRPCDPPTSTGPTTLSGTENGDAETFSGAYSQSVGSMCNPFVSPVDGSWAPATSCPENTVHDWVWEKECDCLHAKSNRRFRRCYRDGVRRLGATLNAPDDCLRELLKPRFVHSTCGRPKAVVCCTEQHAFGRYYADVCAVKPSAKSCVVPPSGKKACISPGQQECFDGVGAASNCGCLDN